MIGHSSRYESWWDYSRDLLMMKVQLAAICDAVKSTVPQEMWGEIIEKLDEAEQHPTALDVGTDSFDDDDDDPYDPWSSPRRTTSFDPADTEGDHDPTHTRRHRPHLAGPRHQLTPEQIAILEDPERHRQDYGTPWSDSELLDIARRYARRNITDEVLFGHIAPPADATRTNGWWRDRHDNWTRGFHGTQRAVDDVFVRVGIFGTQSADGSVTTRHIRVHTIHEFDAAGARRLAAAILDAADELDELQAERPTTNRKGTTA